MKRVGFFCIYLQRVKMGQSLDLFGNLRLLIFLQIQLRRKGIVENMPYIFIIIHFLGNYE